MSRGSGEGEEKKGGGKGTRFTLARVDWMATSMSFLEYRAANEIKKGTCVSHCR
jgi:hypothetical protein